MLPNAVEFFTLEKPCPYVVLVEPPNMWDDVDLAGPQS